MALSMSLAFNYSNMSRQKQLPMQHCHLLDEGLILTATQAHQDSDTINGNKRKPKKRKIFLTSHRYFLLLLHYCLILLLSYLICKIHHVWLFITLLCNVGCLLSWFLFKDYSWQSDFETMIKAVAFGNE